MSENTTRREVLKAATTTGSVVAFGSFEAAASRPSISLIEVGIKYETPDRDDYDSFQLDSRPGYTVDSQANKFIKKKDTNHSVAKTLEEGSKIIDEQRARNGPVSINGSGRKTNFLPTSLSDRKRVMDAINLETEHRLPTITVHWNSKSPAATVQSHGKVEVPSGSTEQISLDTETVTVKTKTVTDTLAEIESVPEWQLSLKREYGTASIDVVPIVEITNYGKLELTAENLA